MQLNSFETKRATSLVTSFDPWSQLIGGASSIIVYYDPANLQGQKELIRGHWNASGVIGEGHRGEVGEMIDSPQTCTLTRLAPV